MVSLRDCLAAWGTPDFNAVLKQALQRVEAAQLPLQQALRQSSHVSGSPHTVMVQSVEESEGRIQARVGVFFTGVVAGCNCADDPTPVDEVNEYCELLIDIDRATGEAGVTLSG